MEKVTMLLLLMEGGEAGANMACAALFEQAECVQIKT
jgi:hypothetical protein